MVADDTRWQSLYHVNAEEEPEELDYPGQKNPVLGKVWAARLSMRAT